MRMSFQVDQSRATPEIKRRGSNFRLAQESGRQWPVPFESVPSQKEKSVLPEEVEHWSLTTLRDKLIKIGAKIVRHGRYVTFQMAEVAILKDLFADILRRIDRLRPKPSPA